MASKLDGASSSKIETRASVKKKSKLTVDEDKGESSKEESKNESNILSYDVLRTIFSYLSGRDLYYSAKVCKLWRDVATCELSIRKVYTHTGRYKDLFKKCNSNIHFDRTIRNKPMLGLIFLSPGDDPPKCISKHLPSNCFCICISSSGLIVENKEYEDNKNLSSYVFLPDDPNVEIDMIASYIIEDKITNRDKSKYAPSTIYGKYDSITMSDIFQMSMKRLKKAQCVILFAKEEGNINGLGIVNFRKVKAVWGGVVDELFVMETHDVMVNHNPMSFETRYRREPDWLGLVISGQYVRSWSTFLDEDDQNEEAIRKKLDKMKNSLQLYKHTVGFMFCCEARGAGWYEKRKNFESTIFKSIFPDIPLIGSFGNGEFGSCNVKACKNYDMKKDGVYRIYSTTFMILTYGQLDENDDND